MIFTKPTLTEMWHHACERMFFASINDPIGIERGSSMTMCYTNLVRAKSMSFELDVWYQLHLTKSRFPVLQKTYLTIEEFEAFLVRCRNVAKERGAVTKLHANPHKPRGINRTKKTGNYAHGGCIHGWNFRIDKSTKQPMLTMLSRVSYISYMGALDLALSYLIAKEVGEQLGYAVEDFGFTWYCESFQYAHMQAVAYTWSRPDFMAALKNPRKYPDAEYPTIKLMRSTIRSFIKKRKAGMNPEDENFAQLMRYRRRWEARVYENNGKWGSVPLSDLSLSALKATKLYVPSGDVEIEEREIA